MTQPAPSPTTDEQLSGRAADAIADMHDELRHRFSGLNTAEAQLAEVLLSAQVANETGRARLQDIQRQLIEAIGNPVNALDTPAGERQFLTFLRSKIAEIQRIVDDGALTANDQAELIEALGSAYLADPLLDDASPAPQPSPRPTARPSPQPAQAAPATGMSTMPTMGGLPQAAMPSAPPSSGLGAAASPLAGLASMLADQPRAESASASPDPAAEEPESGEGTAEEERERESDDEAPADPEDAPTEDTGPAETRPAAS